MRVLDKTLVDVDAFESLTELTSKDIENKVGKLEKDVANMRDPIARAEVEFSGCTASEFTDLTAKLWSMKLKK